MKVRELIQELLKCEMDTDVKIFASLGGDYNVPNDIPLEVDKVEDSKFPTEVRIYSFD